MKKFIPILLFCALYMPLSAQEQEDVVVRRGHYKPAVTDTIREQKEINKTWINLISGNITFYNRGIDDGEIISAGYTRMINIYKGFYIGPGFHIKADSDPVWAADIFFSSMVETKGMLGLKKTGPMARASLGLQYAIGESFAPYFDVFLGIHYRFLSLGYVASYHYCRMNPDGHLDHFDSKLCHGIELSVQF